MPKSGDQIQREFMAYFPRDEVKFKPQSVKDGRAMAIAYIDARCVMDRLDDVVGIGQWWDEYTEARDGSISCHLTVVIDEREVCKTDVGSESEQPDGGDRQKAAYSDALKRAAVKFGIGRYIYSLGSQWLDYDPSKRNFKSPPSLPNWATPPEDQMFRPWKIEARKEPKEPTQGSGRPDPLAKSPAQQPAAEPREHLPGPDPKALNENLFPGVDNPKELANSLGLDKLGAKPIGQTAERQREIDREAQNEAIRKAALAKAAGSPNQTDEAYAKLRNAVNHLTVAGYGDSDSATLARLLNTKELGPLNLPMEWQGWPLETMEKVFAVAKKVYANKANWQKKT